MKAITILLLFCGVVLFIACNDDDTEPTPMPMPSPIDFNGISPTDANGQAIGNEDPTDWTVNDVWDDRTVALFEDSNRSLCTNSSAYEVYPAYANPAQSQVFLNYQFPDSVDVALRMVDRDYNLLQSTDINDVFMPGNNLSVIRLDDLTIKDTVRLYYKIINDDCELRGHGDIVIE